jgi:hypothetical protein
MLAQAHFFFYETTVMRLIYTTMVKDSILLFSLQEFVILGDMGSRFVHGCIVNQFCQ